MARSLLSDRRGFAAAAVLACVAAVPGCDTSKPMRLESEMKVEGAFKLEGPITMQMSGPEIRYEGTFVSQELFEQVKLGTTSRAWIVTVFGEPDRRTELADGSELLVWSYRLGAIAGQMVDVVDIGGEEGQRPATLTTVIRLESGVAAEKWRG